MFDDQVARTKTLLALDQQAFMRKIREFLVNVEKKIETSDQTLVSEEAKVQVLQDEHESFEQQRGVLKNKIEEQEKRVIEAKNQHTQLVDQHNLLLDFQGLLMSNFQPRFFTQQFSDFALARDIGEMTLQKLLDQSTDGLSIQVKGETYWYVKTQGGEYYFHEEPIRNPKS